LTVKTLVGLRGGKEKKGEMSRQQRAAALAALKAAKSGVKLSHIVKDEEDTGLYRDVTEEEYRDLVAKRRQGDDFVEDDSAYSKLFLISSDLGVTTHP
jgi:hypothetical protein